MLAGIGGAYLTIGSVGSFAKGMSSGEGYIALAAMIFGRYTPFGAIAAALLFGFSTQLQSILSTLNVPIQSNLLLMTPYVVTIIVVAGLVGKVRRPRPRASPTSRPEDLCRTVRVARSTEVLLKIFKPTLGDAPASILRGGFGLQGGFWGLQCTKLSRKPQSSRYLVWGRVEWLWVRAY